MNAAAATADELVRIPAGARLPFAAEPRHLRQRHRKLRTADWPDAEKLLAYLKEKGLDVLEEPLAQHPDMAKLHPQSVNTMRIVTDRVGDTVHIAYIVLKIGRGDGFCDNSGQGGVICRVDEKTGKICSVATDDYFNVYETHPEGS
ncbi:MAG: sugar-transfer associated ATP-grasp domain-containing protein [Oscillospiraceae bacterium]